MLWNANTVPREGEPAQPIVLATSRDFRNWSLPIRPFSDVHYCTNPVQLGQGRQWQPTLGVVRGRLWCVWNQGSAGEQGCYCSVLSDPQGKWTNHRIEVGDEAVIDGIRYDRFFPTQNLCQLSSGRVLAPLTVRGPPWKVDQEIADWRRRMKRDTVLYTDDDAQTWHLSPGTTIPDLPWACWEPTVWETDDQLVHMLGRNNNWGDEHQGGDPTTRMMTHSISHDQGRTWSPYQFVPVATISSRAHVLRAAGDRFAMVMNDWRKGDFPLDRQNGALWFNRGGDCDFAPGINFSGQDTRVAYPQMWIRNDAAHVAYTRQGTPASMRYSIVTPLPDPDRYYLFPRSNTPKPVTPRREGNVLCFQQLQRIETRWAKRNDQDVSIAMWVRLQGNGVLLDARKGRTGLLFQIKNNADGLSPSAYLSTPERDLVSDLKMPVDKWCYLGLSVDNRAGTVQFFVDDKTDTKTFQAPAQLTGDTVFFGYKRFDNSRCAGLSGEIRWAAIYDGLRLSPDQHRAARESLTQDSEERALPASNTLPQPSFLLDPSRPDWQQGLVRLDDTAMRVRSMESDGKSIIHFNGEASASVDLDRNRPASGDTVEFQFAFRLASPVPAGQQVVLATTGGGDCPLRIVVDGTQPHMLKTRVGSQLTPIAEFDPNAWTRVHLRVSGKQCAVSTGDRATVAVPFSPTSTWLLLGQGYLEDLVPASLAFQVDLSSVRSRVIMALRSVD